MSSLRKIEIEGNLVGVLTRDCRSRAVRFHSKVAPYDLLDGSRFSGLEDAHQAIYRMSRAARQVKSPTSAIRGDVQ